MKTFHENRNQLKPIEIHGLLGFIHTEVTLNRGLF
jgi:hypothetical protein